MGKRSAGWRRLSRDRDGSLGIETLFTSESKFGGLKILGNLLLRVCQIYLNK